MMSMWYRGKNWYDASVILLSFLLGILVAFVLFAFLISHV